MLFGKNSDRQRNEAHVIELTPAAEHEAGVVACTYISVPQARRTFATMLCRPFWTWGAEMGANECGVVIGNEAMQARSAAPETPALLGMDLLRLALERAATALEAVELIGSLLEEYGQGGNCGHLTPSFYNNGFVIADARNAYVMETVGRELVAVECMQARALSNAYSIGADGGRKSAAFDHGEILLAPDREAVTRACERFGRASALLVGSRTPADFMRILRDHGESKGEQAPASEGSLTLCMHAGDTTPINQTTGAMVSQVHEDWALHWVTATSAPCLSVFKPLIVGMTMPLREPPPTGTFDAGTLWWRHERMHRRAVATGLEVFRASIRDEQAKLEAEFRDRMSDVCRQGDRRRIVAAIEECWRAADAAERRWEKAASEMQGGGFGADSEWRRLSGIANLNLSA